MALDRLTDPAIANVVGTADQVNVSTSGRTGAVVTLSLPQNIATTSTPQFSSITISGNVNAANINANNQISVVSLSGANTVIGTDGAISLFNTMTGIETSIRANGEIKTSNTSLKKQATIHANGYATFRTSGAFSNTYVDLDSNGYISVANGNSFSNTKVDTFSNGFVTVSSSGMSSNTKVDIASNAYILVQNTTANTKIELFGNGQANVGSLYINTVQINPSNPWANSLLIYNGTAFTPGNIPDATTFGTKGIAAFNSTHFTASFGTVSLASNLYSVNQLVQSNTTSITLSSSDAGKLILMNTVGNAFVNVNTFTSFTPGQSVDIIVLSNTMITFANSGSPGITVVGTPGVNTRAQYSAATLICTSTGTYIVVGDLKA